MVDKTTADKLIIALAPSNSTVMVISASVVLWLARKADWSTPCAFTPFLSACLTLKVHFFSKMLSQLSLSMRIVLYIGGSKGR